MEMKISSVIIFTFLFAIVFSSPIDTRTDEKNVNKITCFMFCDYQKLPPAKTTVHPLKEKCSNAQKAAGCDTKRDTCRCYVEID